MSNEVCTYNGFMIIASSGGVGTVSEVPATYAGGVLTITPAVVLEGTLTCESSVTMEGAVVIDSTDGIDIGDGTASDFDLITVLDDVGDAVIGWNDANKLFTVNKQLNWDISADETVCQLAPNTTDGADTSRSRFSGGGGPSVTRGAYHHLFGNEHPDYPGQYTILAGYGGDIVFYAQPSGAVRERFRITTGGNIAIYALRAGIALYQFNFETDGVLGYLAFYGTTNPTNPNEFAIINNTATGDVVIYTNSLERLKVTSTGEVVIGVANGFYWGNPAVNGTWRRIRSGNDLVDERRESGSWVEKGRLTA